MADGSRQPPDRLTVSAQSMGFFELLRRLETPGHRFGQAGGPAREPARLGQGPRMSIATRDVARLVQADPGAAPFVEVEVLGLIGPEGPLPLHLTRWIVERMSHRWFEAGSGRATSDTAALDFLNLLQHRMLALYWRAWGDAQPAVQLEREDGGRIRAMMAALAGIGLPGQDDDATRATETIKLSHAMALAMEVRGPERIERPVADLLSAPVRLLEFVESWIDIPPSLRTRIGQPAARLGEGAVVGERIFSRQDRVELRVGPLGLTEYLLLSREGPVRVRLRHLLLHLAGREVDIDLRLVLAEGEVPEPRIGQIALGRTSWLPSRRPSDRADLRISRITREAA